MNCKICSHETQLSFIAKMLSKYNVKYFLCPYCGFLQTEEPFWLGEAYQTPINVQDTGYVWRNMYWARKISLLLLLSFNRKGKFLDYAGGYGLFVRLMRDIGFDFYWYDKYTENIFARGFEWQKEKMEAITCFEAFEHFVSPLEEIENMLSISHNILFTTELLPHDIPPPEQWWYYGREHGQHISFYSRKTMYYIAKKYNLHYSFYGNLHLFTEKKISWFALSFLRGTVLGIDKILTRILLKSKMWEDYYKLEGTPK